ncbi:MAG TPA: L,D-transpeptidase [Candidatus Nanopelagicales bacterium]|nr:L,D-transpeptidase [Candidatus Nanopelagicales bacterium]
MSFPSLPLGALAAALTLTVLGAPSATAYGDVPSQRATQTSQTSLGASAPTTKRAVPVPPRKVKKPRPATRTAKAKNVPDMPMDGGTGRRIIYDKSLMTVWVMNKDNEVVHRFPIVGRWDRPVAGEYEIYSKSERSGNPNSRVTFDHMTRFAYGNDGKTPIGFHSIPLYYDGSMMHGIDQLGLPIASGGCIRMHEDDAETLYEWASIGDRVVVLASP